MIVLDSPDLAAPDIFFLENSPHLGTPSSLEVFPWENNSEAAWSELKKVVKIIHHLCLLGMAGMNG